MFGIHLNRRSTQNIMGLQSDKNPNFGNFETPNSRVLGQNDIWLYISCLSIENNIRGKVVASSKSRPWWVLWVLVCPWFVRAPKVLQPRTNQLVIWFVQIRLNNWPTYHFLVPIPELQHVSLPPKCYKLRSVPQLFFLPLFLLLDSHWSLSKSVGGCHHHHNLWVYD